MKRAILVFGLSIIVAGLFGVLETYFLGDWADGYSVVIAWGGFLVAINEFVVPDEED